MSDFSISFGFDNQPSAPATSSAGQDEAQIEFLCNPALAGTIPEPQRAVRFAPDWFRNLKPDMGIPDANGLPGLTAKACLPMTDAFALGFVIPMPYDVHLRVPEDGVNIAMGWAENCAFAPLEQHMPEQLGAPEPPFQQVMPLKFINPWRIKVPDGYSVLFQPVMNRPELPFYCFSGLVDCDRFDTTVNLPFIWTGGPGEFMIPAGSPIAQIIPIRRDALIKGHTARVSTEAELAQQDRAATRKYTEESTYRKDWRVKK
ncbi:hypothetical protein FGU71_01565 [Erythrobacter insulae]|uniref:Uncharacterized protein n=1 Tax=Erythrobacter insulae TaxID=2584124 RepID=A0A547P969_9SPHN|nr:hypothetical protein [Erythrobacter insulae]TRD10681.1 hypothetical protein FGU71_01565 [Erythrobacter insulae]